MGICRPLLDRMSCQAFVFECVGILVRTEVVRKGRKPDKTNRSVSSTLESG
jgi:hypothetical protein